MNKESIQKLVTDLILFYVKENYNNHLLEHNITLIPEEELESVIENLYSQRKEHLKGFIKESLKKIMGDEYIGDLVVNNGSHSEYVNVAINLCAKVPKNLNLEESLK